MPDDTNVFSRVPGSLIPFERFSRVYCVLQRQNSIRDVCFFSDSSLEQSSFDPSFKIARIATRQPIFLHYLVPKSHQMLHEQIQGMDVWDCYLNFLNSLKGLLVCSCMVTTSCQHTLHICENTAHTSWSSVASSITLSWH